MVGAGEVDEDLEVETKEECEKYGKVGKCVIFEVSETSLFITRVMIDRLQSVLCKWRCIVSDILSNNRRWHVLVSYTAFTQLLQFQTLASEELQMLFGEETFHFVTDV